MVLVHLSLRTGARGLRHLGLPGAGKDQSSDSSPGFEDRILPLCCTKQRVSLWAGVCLHLQQKLRKLASETLLIPVAGHLCLSWGDSSPESGCGERQGRRCRGWEWKYCQRSISSCSRIRWHFCGNGEVVRTLKRVQCSVIYCVVQMK